MLGTHKRRSYMDPYTWAHKQKIYIHLLSVDTGCCQEDAPRVIPDRDGWWERNSRECMRCARLVYIYIYIYMCVCVCVCDWINKSFKNVLSNIIRMLNTDQQSRIQPKMNWCFFTSLWMLHNCQFQISKKKNAILSLSERLNVIVCVCVYIIKFYLMLVWFFYEVFSFIWRNV